MRGRTEVKMERMVAKVKGLKKVWGSSKAAWNCYLANKRP